MLPCSSAKRLAIRLGLSTLATAMFGREEPKLPHGECWECTEVIDRCKTLPWPEWCLLPNLKLLSGVVRALIVPNRDPFTPSPENIWLRKHHFQSASMAGPGPARLEQIWTALNHQLVQLLDHPLFWWWCKYLQICVGLCVLNVSNSCGRDETAVVLPLAFRSLPWTTHACNDSISRWTSPSFDLFAGYRIAIHPLWDFQYFHVLWSIRQIHPCASIPCPAAPVCSKTKSEEFDNATSLASSSSLERSDSSLPVKHPKISYYEYPGL